MLISVCSRHNAQRGKTTLLCPKTTHNHGLSAVTDNYSVSGNHLTKPLPFESSAVNDSGGWKRILRSTR